MAVCPDDQLRRLIEMTSQTVGFAFTLTRPSYGLGTEDGHTYHGYVAEALDPTVTSPVFTGGPVNDAAKPLYPRGWDIDMFADGDLNEIVQVRCAPLWRDLSIILS
jgi:hypothetical protein